MLLTGPLDQLHRAKFSMPRMKFQAYPINCMIAVI